MKKILSIVFAFVFACGFNFFASAKTSTYATLMFYYNPCKITNSQGQTLNYKDFNNYSGDLKVIKENYIDPDMCEFTVEDSDWFSYTPSKKNNCEFCVISEKLTVFVDGKSIDNIKISSENEKENIEVSGSNSNCNISGYFSKSKLSVDLSCKTKNGISFCSSKSGIDISGISAKCHLKIDNKSTDYYSIDGSLKISKNGGKIKVKNGLKIPSKTSKRISSLRVKPIGKNKMALTWQKVKKAKSYIVYKYDYDKKTYKKVAVRNGNGANYYVEKNIDNTSKYLYKVSAKTKSKGKGKLIEKRSYAVSAVSKDNKKGNASAIKINQTKKVVLKKGKTVNLSATVTAKNKKVLSNKVRWYSSNKKIAKVNRKTGKVTAKKKGVCYVWAKAHNGKNSKRLKIKVK